MAEVAKPSGRRGGSKPGERRGGRRKGTPNRKTAEQVRAVKESGLTPLEFMLQSMRDEGLDLAIRHDMAKAAAPYVHPRLATVEQKGDLSLTVKVERF